MCDSQSISTPVQRTPDITWYQHKENVSLSLSILLDQPKQDFSYNLNLSGDQLEVVSDSYNFKTTLYQPVRLVTHGYNGRILEIILEKTPTDEGEHTFWETLTRDRAFNKRHVRINWNYWIDEDDSEYTGVPNMDDMSWGNYGGEGFDEYMREHEDCGEEYCEECNGIIDDGIGKCQDDICDLQEGGCLQDKPNSCEVNSIQHEKGSSLNSYPVCMDGK
jgi:hypothetical protein